MTPVHCVPYHWPVGYGEESFGFVGGERFEVYSRATEHQGLKAQGAWHCCCVGHCQDVEDISAVRNYSGVDWEVVEPRLSIRLKKNIHFRDSELEP